MSTEVSLPSANRFPASGGADAHWIQDTPLTNFTSGSREAYRTKTYRAPTHNSGLKSTSSTSGSLMLSADSFVMGGTKLSPTAVTFGPSKKIGDKRAVTAAAQQTTPSTPDIISGFGLDHANEYFASAINAAAMMPTPPISPTSSGTFSTSRSEER